MNEFVKEWTEAFGTSSYQKNIILEVSLPCRRDQWRANCSEFCCYSTGKAWACSGWCCVAVFEWSSIFQGSTLRQKVNKNSRESLKLTRFTSPPPKESMKDYRESLSDIASCKENSDKPSCWKEAKMIALPGRGLAQLIPLGRNKLQPVQVPVSCVPGPQLL